MTIADVALWFLAVVGILSVPLLLWIWPRRLD